MPGSTAKVGCNMPQSWMSSSSAKSSGVCVDSGPTEITPALLTSTSTAPSRRSTSWTNAATCERLETSHGIATARSPRRRPARPSCSSPRAHTATRAPWRTSSCATARPRPREPPVTTATRSVRSSAIARFRSFSAATPAAAIASTALTARAFPAPNRAETLEVGGARALDGVVDGEVSIEARDLERPAGLERRRGEHERTAVRQPRARLDEHAERGRVDELDLAQVDDEALGSLVAAPQEGLSHRLGVVEVEFAGEGDDDGAVVPRYPRDRVLSDPCNSVRSRPAFLGHASLLSAPATPPVAPCYSSKRGGVAANATRMLASWRLLRSQHGRQGRTSRSGQCSFRARFGRTSERSIATRGSSTSSETHSTAIASPRSMSPSPRSTSPSRLI